MPVRVRVMGASEAGSSVPIPPAATVAGGGFMFSVPSRIYSLKTFLARSLAGIRSIGIHGCVGGRSACGPFVSWGRSRSR